MDRGAWRATVPWGHKETDTTEHLSAAAVEASSEDKFTELLVTSAQLCLSLCDPRGL